MLAWSRIANKNKLFIPNSIDFTHTIVVSHLLLFTFTWDSDTFLYEILYYNIFFMAIAMSPTKAAIGNEFSLLSYRGANVVLQRQVILLHVHNAGKREKSFNLDWAWIPSLIMWGWQCPLMNCSVELGWWILMTCDRTEEISGWCFFSDLKRSLVNHLYSCPAHVRSITQKQPSACARRAKAPPVTMWLLEVKTKGDSEFQI